MSTDPYEVLGVPHDADARAVQTAYRRLMRRYHPDMPTGDAQKAAEVSTAYSLLSDEGRRAAYDLDRRRAAEQTTPRASTPGPRPSAGGSSAGYVVPDTVPPPGPVTFRDYRPTDWIPTVVAVVALFGAVVTGPSFLPVLAVALASSVAAVLPLNKVVPVSVHAAIVPAAVVGTSMDPMATWLDTGTVPLVVLATVALVVAVGSTVYGRHRLTRHVGYTQDARWIFTDGRPPHPFLAGLGNVAGWVGLTGSAARFDTVLLNGTTAMVLATVRPTHPGERLAWSRGRLLRTRAGSSTGVPEPGLDLLGWKPAGVGRLQVRYAVFVPGLPLGAGPDGEVSVLGEDDLLAWMSTVQTRPLDRRDVGDAAHLVGSAAGRPVG